MPEHFEFYVEFLGLVLARFSGVLFMGRFVDSILESPDFILELDLPNKIISAVNSLPDQVGERISAVYVASEESDGCQPHVDSESLPNHACQLQNSTS